MLARALRDWGGQQDLWVFGYASLIWRPEFEAAEQRVARLHGYHRALKMWSRVNRGTPDCPGLVFALLSGGSCQGMAFRIPLAQGEQALRQLWPREMITGVYDPKWLRCQTSNGVVRALAFTLPRHSPNYTGSCRRRATSRFLPNPAAAMAAHWTMRARPRNTCCGWASGTPRWPACCGWLMVDG